jgi:PAS domain S-box-containing protein
VAFVPTPSLPADAELYEDAPCGLLACSTSGAILRANATFCRWLGYAWQELSGMRIQDLLTVGGRLFFHTHCAPLLSMQGSVAEVQVELLTRDGARLPVLINIARRLRDPEALDEFAVFVATDRRQYEQELRNERSRAEAALQARQGAQEQLRQANEQLSQAHRRKDEFLATLAHELRNPLAPIRNVVEVMRMKQAVNPDSAWALEVLDRQTSQLTHLVDDLMDVARITQGRLQLRRKPCDLVAIARAAVDDIAAMAQAASHRLELRLPQQPIMVDADDTRLTQVVANLLTNAIKYTPNGGLITLTVEPRDGQGVVAVRDTGIGIPPSALASIFDMFSQLTPALERSQGGLGIGLALVRGLVDLHGGTITASSDGAGKGSTFTVALPLLQDLPQAEPTAAGSRCAGPCRVLVVDDNVDAAETLSMALELLGHEVRTAHTGAEGLQLAALFQPALVLLDIGLPDINGYEIARRIRHQPWGAGMLLVAATGWGQETDRARAMGAGFDAHLIKPIDFDRLHALLATLQAR